MLPVSTTAAIDPRRPVANPGERSPVVIPDAATDEPWGFSAINLEARNGGGLGIHLTLEAPPAVHRDYLTTFPGFVAELRAALQEAHGEFLTATEAGRRLTAIRATIADGERSQAQARQAERELRTAASNGRARADHEERLRAALIDVQIQETKLATAREALPGAEAAAKSALVEHVQRTRSEWIRRARQRIDQAGAKVAEVAGAHVLELAKAVAEHHQSQAPVPPELLQLES